MPRSTSPAKQAEAERLYICANLPVADIENRTGIPASTVREWARANVWNTRRAAYLKNANTLPERMQMLALSMEENAHREFELANTPDQFSRANESANRAIYAMGVADQRALAHAKQLHVDLPALALAFLDELVAYAKADGKFLSILAPHIGPFAERLKVSTTRLVETINE